MASADLIGVAEALGDVSELAGRYDDAVGRIVGRQSWASTAGTERN